MAFFPALPTQVYGSRKRRNNAEQCSSRALALSLQHALACAWPPICLSNWKLFGQTRDSPIGYVDSAKFKALLLLRSPHVTIVVPHHPSVLALSVSANPANVSLGIRIDSACFEALPWSWLVPAVDSSWAHFLGVFGRPALVPSRTTSSTFVRARAHHTISPRWEWRVFQTFFGQSPCQV